jgi:hypothetical protein
VPEHQRLHQHVDAVVAQLLGEASYGVGDITAGAHVDPDQAAVGLVQHRRVGHLDGHRVADPRRGRLRLVESGGEVADEVDAVGRQQLCLRFGREPLRRAAAAASRVRAQVRACTPRVPSSTSGGCAGTRRHAAYRIARPNAPIAASVVR